MAAMSPSELLAAWEDAYLAQCQTARVGKLFRGTVHNLNGVVQAFSMQSELFAMMFVKADNLLGEAFDLAQNETAREKITQTRELLQKRQKTLGQVEEKIVLSQEILNNNDDICQPSVDGSTVTLHSLIDNIVSFFNSHMFFKHKVQKNISVDADLALGEHAFALSVVIANLVENSIAALQENGDGSPCFAIRCYPRDDKVIIDVEDNGVGIPEQLNESLFEPFISATPGNSGLGLYLARKLLSGMAGEMIVSGLRNPTVFTIVLPFNLEKA